jgi:hypothetical protein
MLRRAWYCAIGGWGSTSLGLTSLPFGTSCTQDLQAARRYIPSRLPAFSTCSFPLWVSPPGRLSALEGHSLSTFCLYEAISRAPKRRTTMYHITANLCSFGGVEKQQVLFHGSSSKEALGKGSNEADLDEETGHRLSSREDDDGIV